MYIAEVSTAPAPFNKPNADMVLRSSDNVDFRLPKQILALTSDFFELMFSVPQAAQLRPAASETDRATGLPLVCVEEDADVLHNL